MSGFADIQSFQVRGTGSNAALEAQTRWNFWPAALLQATWSSPLTNRLLIEAGWSTDQGAVSLEQGDHHGQFRLRREPGRRCRSWSCRPGFATTRATCTITRHTQDRYVERFSVSYVTGSHAFKTGFQLQQGFNDTDTEVNSDVNYTFLRGVPTQITQFATPYGVKNGSRPISGSIVQDRWTLNRLALNMGLRLDYFNGYVPAQHLPATPSGWIPERNFDAVSSVPEWTDLNPRVGASYDLFGNSRTALKASIGRYVGPMGMNVAGANNPVTTSVTQVNRIVDRPQQRLCSGLRLGQLRGQWGVRADQQHELRQEQSPRDPLCRRRHPGIRPSRLLLGLDDRSATSARVQDVGDGGLQPQLDQYSAVPRSAGSQCAVGDRRHGQPRGHAG